MVGVEQWAEIRRMYFVGRLGIREIARRLGLSREFLLMGLDAGSG